MSKKYSILHIVFAIISLILNIFPLSFYVIKGIIGDALTSQKVGLVSTVFVAAIMTVISLVNKRAMRSRLWIFLIGLYACLDNFLRVLVAVAVCQIIDELIVYPLTRLFRAKKLIHRELDRRL